MNEEIVDPVPTEEESPVDFLKPIAIEQKDGETFEEMCKRLHLNPHCVCTFK
jgi:hypothetical protein